jgi:acyl carrier protein
MSHTTTVAQFIVDEFAPDLDPDRIDPDYDLLEGGIIDSLALLTIVAWIDDRFGVGVDAGAIGEDDLRTLRAIGALIDTVTARAGAPG